MNENTLWDEADSANWTEDDLTAAYVSAWQGVGLPDECRWDDVED